MNQEPSNSHDCNDTPADVSLPLIVQEIGPDDDLSPSNEEIERLSQSLVNYASKHQLSLRNVRSIIKQLLTDQRLIIFAQQLAGDITEESLKISETKTSSKLTRSKRKERSIQQDVTGEGGATALLDLSFSERETSSDEEYNPLIDLTNNEESRDKSEPQDDVSTPSSQSSIDLSPEQTFNDIDSVFQPQNDLYYTPCSSNEQTIDPDIQSITYDVNSYNDEIKSYSTRSRDNLRQKSLLELEADLIQPDLRPESPEEFSNGGDSETWRNWLASFFLADNSERSGSDSDDADYNFLQDIDKEINLTEKKEEFRYDFQVRVSQREILELVNSLVEEGGPWASLPDASEGCVSENEYNYRVESERDNKLTLEVLESGVELTPEQKV
ncbi:GON-4-like protein [Oopsacas minuta]|uniref:GON-4-like protein n=1 Tax=Oopsacas minuta TaxID=111878 RepID=A0AAV7JTF0_9METZ|nr:GON-4-like protein [Oopsacas minuta]